MVVLIEELDSLLVDLLNISLTLLQGLSVIGVGLFDCLNTHYGHEVVSWI